VFIYITFTRLVQTDTPPFNGLFSRSTWVTGTRKVKPLWISLEQETMAWQWHQLHHMQIICLSLQTDNHNSTSSLKSFYRPDALPDAQTKVSKHWRQLAQLTQAQFIWKTVTKKDEVVVSKQVSPTTMSAWSTIHKTKTISLTSLKNAQWVWFCHIFNSHRSLLTISISYTFMHFL